MVFKYSIFVFRLLNFIHFLLNVNLPTMKEDLFWSQKIGLIQVIYFQKMSKKDVMRLTASIIISNIKLPSIKLRFLFSDLSLQINFNKALIDQSVTCKQKLRHICSTNALTNLSSWTGWNGEMNTYWSGDKNSSETGNESFTITLK